MQNSFSYERFRSYARFETEAQENSEMAYLELTSTGISLLHQKVIFCNFELSTSCLEFIGKCYKIDDWRFTMAYKLFPGLPGILLQPT